MSDISRKLEQAKVGNFAKDVLTPVGKIPEPSINSSEQTNPEKKNLIQTLQDLINKLRR